MKKQIQNVGMASLVGLLLNACGNPGSSSTPTPTTTLTPTPPTTPTPTPTPLPPPPSLGTLGVPAQAYQDQLYRVDLSGITGTITAVSMTNAPSWLTYNAGANKLEGVPVETEATALATSISNLEIRLTVNGNQYGYGPYALTVNRDPLKKYQWHLTNTGQANFSNNPGTPGVDLSMADTVKAGAKGTGVKVAVSDSGVEIAHTDLSANVIANASRNYGTHPSPPYEDNPTPPSGAGAAAGHGTAVAGIIAAVGWNGIGVRGVAPESQFAGFRFLDSSISQTTAVYLNQATGDFDIFNYSYGGSSFYPPTEFSEYRAQIEDGVTNGRSGKGSLYVKAAGNEFLGSGDRGSLGSSDCFVNPSATNTCLFLGNANFSDVGNVNPNMIVVGALNALGTKSSYSSPGSDIWITAMGGEYGNTDPAIMTTDIRGCSAGFASGLARNSFDTNSFGLNPLCHYTSAMNGTSAATPMISGVIALILEANPALTWRDVKHILATTAVTVTDDGSKTHPYNFNSTSWNLSGQDYRYGWLTNGAGFSFHNWYGFGLVNVDAAVALAKTYVAGSFGAQSTIDWITSSDTPMSIPDNNSTGVTSAITVPNVPASLVVESVEVKLQTTHLRISDLMVELTSPASASSGMKSILLHYNSGIINDPDLASADYKAVFLSNAFYGENAAGEWKLRVLDARTGQTGNLTNWKIKIVGHTLTP